MLGGTFTDIPSFNPRISSVITDQIYLEQQTEPVDPVEHWYPRQLGSIVRLPTVEGRLYQRLVVVPAQFRATRSTDRTTGVERLYHRVSFQVYDAPSDATDFIAPDILQVRVDTVAAGRRFQAQVRDDAGSIQRVVVLYGVASLVPGTSASWSKVELDYNPATGWAEATVPAFADPLAYFVQAVDGAGNVALGLDNGDPFATTTVDSTPPLTTPLVDGLRGSDGWFRGDISVVWLTTDAQSTITARNGCSPVTITADTAGTLLTCSATSAGGTSTHSITVRRDATPPAITWSGDIRDGDSYSFGSVPAVDSCSAQDALAGPGGCIVGGYDTAVGSHLLTATAWDAAGNTATSTRRYSVLPWRLSGFYQPVDMSTGHHHSTTSLRVVRPSHSRLRCIAG